MTIYGAAHVDGAYHINTPGTGSFIQDGFELIKDLGFDAVKLFLSRLYASGDYPLETEFAGTPATLTELVQEPPFAAVLGDAAVKHYILNTFPLTTLGDTDPWKFGLAFGNETLLQDEYTEVRAFAEHLLQTYDGDAKTFVLKSWEGDWSLQGSTVLDGTQYNFINRRREDLMVAYFRARGRAIADARTAQAGSDCQVLHAVEANRVTEAVRYPTAPRMLNRILPRLRGAIDLVSYSAYDSIFDLSPGSAAPWSASQAQMLADIQTRLTNAVGALQNASGVPCMLGEWGLPETELPEGYSVQTIIEKVVEVGEELGLIYNLYWQVFDNEDRGFWLYDDNGDVSLAGQAWAALLA